MSFIVVLLAFAAFLGFGRFLLVLAKLVLRDFKESALVQKNIKQRIT